jgi:hypothetical protein
MEHIGGHFGGPGGPLGDSYIGGSQPSKHGRIVLIVLHNVAIVVLSASHKKPSRAAVVPHSA